MILAIQTLKGEKFHFIVEELVDYLGKLALDQFGICIVNKIIQLGPKPEHIKKIVDMLSVNITEIIQSPYGNYAITTALEVCNFLYNS